MHPQRVLRQAGIAVQSGVHFFLGGGFALPGDDLLLELAESFGVSVEELVSSDFRDKVLSMDENADRVEELEEELEEAEKRYKAAPETVTKMIRFREKFTFLNSPDCPDILKILVSDMFTAYGKYKEAFARLEVTPDDVSSLSTAQEAQARLDQAQARVAETPVALTRTEFDLLVALSARPHQPLSRRQLIDRTHQPIDRQP